MDKFWSPQRGAPKTHRHQTSVSRCSLAFPRTTSWYWPRRSLPWRHLETKPNNMTPRNTMEIYGMLVHVGTLCTQSHSVSFSLFFTFIYIYMILRCAVSNAHPRSWNTQTGKPLIPLRHAQQRNDNSPFQAKCPKFVSLALASKPR
jgi:hypothetical protein